MTEKPQNPFKLGTKKFLVAEKLLSGRTDDNVVASEVGVQIHTVWNTKSELRRLKLLVKPDPNASPSTIIHSSTPPPNSLTVPSSSVPKEPTPPSIVSSELPKDLSPSSTASSELTSYAKKEDLDQIKSEIASFKNEVLEAIKTVNRHDDSNPVKETEEETLEDSDQTDASELANPKLEPDRIRISKGSLVPKNVLLTPKTLMLYDIAQTDGYQGNLSEYLNDVVKFYYEKRLGLTLGLLQKREIA